MDHRRRPDSSPEARQDLVRRLDASRSEEETLLTSLLGASWKDEMLYELRFATADMPSAELIRPEVAVQIRAAEKTYQDRRALILAKSATGPSPELGAELRDARLSRDSELRTVLDEKEFLDYQVEQSDLGKDWMIRANRMGLTHSETAELVSLEMQAADAYVYGSSEGDGVDLDDPWRAIEERKRAVLGPERYDEYERLQDPAYAGIQDLATQHGLPPEAATAATEAHRTFVGLLGRAAGDPDRGRDVTLGGLTAVHKAHLERITELLGTDAAQEYSREILWGELNLGSMLSTDEDDSEE